MESINAIKNHLYLKGERDATGLYKESCLVHALRNIRFITGRNQDTGISTPDGYLGNWIGAIGYMAILDQIGTCFRPTSFKKVDNPKMPSIQKALIYFTNLNEEERFAIYALRNAFHHNFSLINIDDKISRHKYDHHFIVDATPSSPLIKLPTSKWDGKIENLNQENHTYVNLQAFGDLVEKIYKTLLELESKNELSLELDGGESELQARYLFCHY
jgi:hypothetical protein